MDSFLEAYERENKIVWGRVDELEAEEKRLKARIEKLEAALRWYEWSMCELGDGHGACGKLRDDECAGCRAHKALEGKDAAQEPI